MRKKIANFLRLLADKLDQNIYYIGPTFKVYPYNKNNRSSFNPIESWHKKADAQWLAVHKQYHSN